MQLKRRIKIGGIMKNIARFTFCTLFLIIFSSQVVAEGSANDLRGCLFLSSNPNYGTCPTPSLYQVYDIYGMLDVYDDSKGARFRIDIPHGVILSVEYNTLIVHSIVGDSLTQGVDIFLADCYSPDSIVNLFHVSIMNDTMEPYYISYEPHSEGGFGVYSCEPGWVLYDACLCEITVNGECSTIFFCGGCEDPVPSESKSWGAIKSLFEKP